MSNYLPPMTNGEIEQALTRPALNPKAFALALRHRDKAANEYENMRAAVGNPFEGHLGKIGQPLGQ